MTASPLTRHIPASLWSLPLSHISGVVKAADCECVCVYCTCVRYGHRLLNVEFACTRSQCFDDLEKCHIALFYCCLSSHWPDPSKVTIVSLEVVHWLVFPWNIGDNVFKINGGQTAFSSLFCCHCCVISLLTHIAVWVKSHFSQCVFLVNLMLLKKVLSIN